MYKRSLSLFLVIVFSVLAVSVSAQGVASLTYGASATGTLSPESPLSLYVFSGNAGDFISAEVLGLEPGMTPTLSLLAPSQQPLNNGALEQLAAGSRTASVSRTLPGPGTYTLLVGGTSGQYLIRLNGTPAPASMTPVTVPGSLNLTLNADLTEQVVSVSNAAAGPVALSVAGGSATAPFSFSAYNADGVQVAHLSAAAENACVSLPGGSGNLLVLLKGANNGQPLNVTLSVSEGSCSSQSGSPPPVQQPQQPQQPSGQQSATCSASSGSNVNVRSGPGTNYNVITQLQGGQQVPVVGASDGGWVVVNLNGVDGFVSLSVIGTFGNCNSLPYVPAPPAGQQPQQPQQPAAPTATQVQQQPPPTATQAQDQQQEPPTATQQQQQPPPTATATEPPPPTATPTTAVQEAPPDSNYALNVQLDGNASASDYVSYPGGDTEDVVSYRVSGLNPSVAFSGGQADLTFSFSCFGTGTQYISFIVDGQTKSCGQSHVRRVNFDSNTGGVRIRATGGEGTYVQWVVQATAPRTN